jgi:hypothetical protein
MPPHRSSAVVLAATTGIEVLAREDPGWLTRPSLTDLWHLLLPCVAAPQLAGALDPAGTEPVHAEADVGSQADGALAAPGRAGLALR